MKTLLETVNNEITNYSDPIVGNKLGISLPLSGNYEYTKYMDQNKGYDRAKMPQINHNNAMASVIAHLSTKYAIKRKKLPINKLKPTQTEISNAKVIKHLNNHEFEKNIKTNAFIVSKDLYLVDGHHQWASVLQYNPDTIVDVYIVDLPIEKLINVLNRMKHTTNDKVNV